MTLKFGDLNQWNNLSLKGIRVLLLRSSVLAQSLLSHEQSFLACWGFTKEALEVNLKMNFMEFLQGEGPEGKMQERYI